MIAKQILKIITFFLILSSFKVFTQDYLNPVKKTSFGLNNHTSRDISYFSISNDFGHVYNIGTTERDSTFTDLITSKFDVDLNLMWQKRYSINTGLSYDVPLACYFDSKNNLIVIGKSSFKQSNSNGLIFIVKYDSNGEILWDKTIGNIDGSNYYDYEYFNSYFKDDILRITYVPFDSNTSNGRGESKIKFLKIDFDGSIEEEFITNVSNNGISSVFKNGIHYTLIRKDSAFGNSNYYLRRLGYGIDENYFLNNQSNYIEGNFSVNLNAIQLKVDSNENLYVIKPKIKGYENSSSCTKINKSGQIEYSKNTSLDYNLLGSYIDTDNKVCLLYEDASVDKIIYKKLDDFGAESEVISVNYENLTGSKINDDNSLYVVNTNSVISLLNKDLSLANNFHYSSSFPISDITKINDSEVVVAGTTYEKMYPTSDFFSQNNIVLEKLSPTQILNTYSFSGEGTSKAFQQRVIIDNNDNYIVLSQEKLGPDNWKIGGSRADLNKSIIKYDSNLNIIWRIEVPNFIIGFNNNVENNIIIDSENSIYINSSLYNLDTSPNSFELIKIDSNGNIIFKVPSYRNRNIYLDQNNNINIVSPPTDNNITFDDDTTIYTFNSITGNLVGSKVFEGLEFLKHYTSTDGGSFLYMYTGANTYGDTSPRMDIYKNLVLNFSLNLAITGTYGAIDYLSIDLAKNGDLFFGSSWGQINEKLHKITLSNTYSYVNVNNRFSRLRVMNNGKVFTILDLVSNNEGIVNVYNNDLTLFSSYADKVYNYSDLLEINGKMLLNSNYNNLVKVFTYNSVLVDEFKIPSNLSYSAIDSNNNLILTGQFGNQIYTYHEYSWARGLLHKYKYNGPIDQDNDGVGDSMDLCIDTPNTEEVDDNGCSESQKDDDRDGIMNNIDKCGNTPIGQQVDGEGCSESEKDDDGDGITNDIDHCPNTVLIDFVNSEGCFVLPPNNFIIKSIGETCPGKNNAKVVISTNERHDYVATLNGVNYNFTTDLTIDNLPPGNYELCIRVPSELYEQCYAIALPEGSTITGKSSITKSGKVSFHIEKGTAPYSVSINGRIVLQTGDSTFSIDAFHGDYIEVVSSKTCEGKLSNTIQLIDEIFAYPNPTNGEVEISLPTPQTEITIELYNIQSQLISSYKYPIKNGKVNISLKENLNGIYFAKVYLNEPISLKIIKQ